MNTIASVPFLNASLSNPANSDVLLDSRKVLGWRCLATSEFGGCGKSWNESVIKRAQFALCPQCSPNKTRKAVVYYVAEDDNVHTIPLPKKKTPPKRTPKVNKTMCEVCCLEQTSGKILACGVCEYKACKTCVREYAMTCVGEARCMNTECQTPYTKHFLATHLTKKWLKETYLTKIKRGWIAHELTRIPETMGLVELMKRYEVILGRKSALLANVFNEVTIVLGNMQPIRRLVANKAHPDYPKYLDVSDEANDLIARMFAYPHDLNGITENRPAPVKYTQVCPKDGCIGLVAESDDGLVCKVCDTLVCKRCHMVMVTDAHACKNSDVESVKAMSKDTKPCPSCAVPIYKIDGCDQMWCVKCNTSFSWDLRTINTGPVHNPHYFQWLRSQTNGDIPRVQGDVVGGCLIGNYNVEGATLSMLKHLGVNEMVIFNRLRAIASTQNGGGDTGMQSSLHNARAHYILKPEKRSQWERSVIHTYTLHAYYSSREAIRATLRQIAQERITACLTVVLANPNDELEIKKAYDACMTEMDNARVYFNQALVDENPERAFSDIQVYSAEWLEIEYDKYRKQERQRVEKEAK